MTEKRLTNDRAVRDIPREAGRPMATAEIAAELAKRVKLTTKNPNSSVQGALSYNPTCVAIERGTYVYVRTGVNGAAVRDRIRLVSVKGGYCAVGAELIGLLWPGFAYDEPRRNPTLSLADGPAVEVIWPKQLGRPGQISGPFGTLKLPAPFWAWWNARTSEGADEIVVRCEDGEAGRYTVRAVRRSDLDPSAITEATQAAREAANDALRGTDRGVSFEMFVLRMLVRAPYRRDVPPDPLPDVLLCPFPTFELTDFNLIIPRPDLTPAIARLFQDRLLDPWFSADRHTRDDLKRSPLIQPTQTDLIASISPTLRISWAALRPNLRQPPPKSSKPCGSKSP